MLCQRRWRHRCSRVNDKATKRREALVGVEPRFTVESIRRGIFDRTKPAVTAIVEKREEAGIPLMVIEIPAGVGPVANTAGTATRRLGTECRPFTPDQQRDVLISRGQLDWSAQSAGVAPGHVDKAELSRLRRLLGAAGSEELVELSDRQFLEALRLIATDGSVTNAAVLLLGDDETLRRIVPTHEVSYQYRPTPGSEATHRFRHRQASKMLRQAELQADDGTFPPTACSACAKGRRA